MFLYISTQYAKLTLLYRANKKTLTLYIFRIVKQPKPYFTLVND